MLKEFIIKEDLNIPINRDLYDSTSMKDNLYQLYKWSYLYSILKNKKYYTYSRRYQNTAKEIEKSLNEIIKITTEQLIPIFEDWLDNHALLDPSVWAKKRLDYMMEAGESEIGIFEDFEYSVARHTGNSGLINKKDKSYLYRMYINPRVMDCDDMLEYISDYMNLVLSEFEDSPTDLETNNEKFNYLIAVFGHREFWTSLLEYEIENGTAEDFLLALYEHVYFYFWFEEWEAKGIVEIRENVQKAYDYLNNMDNYSINDKIVYMNVVINTAHASGDMLEYVSNHYDGLDKTYLNRLSDIPEDKIGEWERELNLDVLNESLIKEKIDRGLFKFGLELELLFTDLGKFKEYIKLLENELGYKSHWDIDADDEYYLSHYEPEEVFEEAQESHPERAERINVHPDYSIKNYGDEGYGMEVTFPALNLTPANVLKVGNLLAQTPHYYIYTNSSCSMHVHLSWPGLNDLDMFWVLCNIAVDEEFVDMLVKFKNYGFVSQFSTNIFNTIRPIIESGNFDEVYAQLKKYNLINLHPQGTIEWRGPRKFLDVPKTPIVEDFLHREQEIKQFFLRLMYIANKFRTILDSKTLTTSRKTYNKKEFSYYFQGYNVIPTKWQLEKISINEHMSVVQYGEPQYDGKYEYYFLLFKGTKLIAKALEITQYEKKGLFNATIVLARDSEDIKKYVNKIYDNKGNLILDGDAKEITLSQELQSEESPGTLYIIRNAIRNYEIMDIRTGEVLTKQFKDKRIGFRLIEATDKDEGIATLHIDGRKGGYLFNYKEDRIITQFDDYIIYDKNNKFYYKDKVYYNLKGEPISKRYDAYKELFSRVHINYKIVSLKDKVGVINYKDGKFEEVFPVEYDDAKDLYIMSKDDTQLFYAVMKKEGKKDIYVHNKKTDELELVFSNIYDYEIEKGRTFLIKKEVDGKYAIATYYGEVLTDYLYDGVVRKTVYINKEEYYYYNVMVDRKWGIVDNDGIRRTQLKYDFLLDYFNTFVELKNDEGKYSDIFNLITNKMVIEKIKGYVDIVKRNDTFELIITDPDTQKKETVTLPS